MKIFTDKRLLRAGLISGTVSRHSGNMRELANQETVYQALGINPAHVLHFHQVHGRKIFRITCAQEAQTLAAQPLQDGDGWLLSPVPTGWGAAIVTADCVPLFLWDNTGAHVALAHCGWRGVVQGLPREIARELGRKTVPSQLNAWLGPHIQACCFEVQEDVASQFSTDCVRCKNGKMFVDLNVEIKRQLMQAGLDILNITVPDYCTCGDEKNFFSWRRDHEKNLLLSFIYKP